MFALSELELATVLDDMDSPRGAWSGDDRREQERFRYRYRLTVIMLVHGDVTQVPHAVMGRNLSRLGFEFLTDAPVVADTGCTVLLKAVDGKLTQARGVVVRSDPVRPNIYGVGVRFEAPVEVDQFADALNHRA